MTDSCDIKRNKCRHPKLRNINHTFYGDVNIMCHSRIFTRHKGGSDGRVRYLTLDLRVNHVRQMTWLDEVDLSPWRCVTRG